MKRVENALSRFIPDSAISKINQQAGTRPVQISREVLDIIQTALFYSELCDGAFDISLGPLMELWKNAQRIILGMPKYPSQILGMLGG